MKNLLKYTIGLPVLIAWTIVLCGVAFCVGIGGILTELIQGEWDYYVLVMCGRFQDIMNIWKPL